MLEIVGVVAVPDEPIPTTYPPALAVTLTVMLPVVEADPIVLPDVVPTFTNPPSILIPEKMYGAVDWAELVFNTIFAMVFPWIFDAVPALAEVKEMPQNLFPKVLFDQVNALPPQLAAVPPI